MCGKGLCMMAPGVARDLMDAEREREIDLVVMTGKDILTTLSTIYLV